MHKFKVGDRVQEVNHDHKFGIIIKITKRKTWPIEVRYEDAPMDDWTGNYSENELMLAPVVVPHQPTGEEVRAELLEQIKALYEKACGGVYPAKADAYYEVLVQVFGIKPVRKTILEYEVITKE